MMYPFITLNDDTEIVHSEMIDGRVKVYIETPDEKLCFKRATCCLPVKLKEALYNACLIALVMVGSLFSVGCNNINDGSSSNSSDDNFAGGSFLGEWKNDAGGGLLRFGFSEEENKPTIEGDYFTGVEDFFSYSISGSYAVIWVQWEGRKNIHSIAVMKGDGTLSWKGDTYTKVS